MPVLAGIAATRMTSGIDLPTPIIALTAHALQGDRKRLLAEGFDGYVSKPVDIELLSRELQRVTEGQRMTTDQDRKFQQVRSRASSLPSSACSIRCSRQGCEPLCCTAQREMTVSP